MPEPAELESEESFAVRARHFVEETLPGLLVPPAPGDSRPVHVLLDHADATDASVRLARQWRRAKFDAGFGAITEPAEHGGAGLPEAYEARYADVEAQYPVTCTNSRPPSPGCGRTACASPAPRRASRLSAGVAWTAGRSHVVLGWRAASISGARAGRGISPW
jgi:alkylation response protein AidB-like acyl-CoA dehydrogenase